jgi:DNA repair exonuclease SbcCD ATPase subunit
MESEIKAEERDPKKLVRAMQMVTKVLIQDELQSVRQSVTDLETRLDERFAGLREELRKDLTEVIDKAREELGSRIDPLFETMSEAERFRSEVIADLETQVEKTQSTADEQIKSLQERLDEKEAALRRDLESLAEEQVGLRAGAQEQVENSKRLSGVLQNLASVFSASTGASLQGTKDGIAVSDAGDDEVVIEEFLDQTPDGESAEQKS